MGSKRKEHPTSSEDDCSKKFKVKTECTASPSLLISFQTGHSAIAMKGMAIEGRLSVLERTIHDIMESPESMRDHVAHAGPDVKKATAELDRAFRGRSSPLPSLADTSKPDYTSKAHQGSKAAVIRGQGHLPALPPILDQSLEKAVFTHPGVSNNHEATYDRLEILGDAYIELIATKLIWFKFRDLPSGRISQIRESLVKNEALSEFATKYEFDRRASVPRDYLNQPKRWIKTKGDIFEAYVAAVILSDPLNGYKVAENWLTALWTPRLETMDDPAICLHAKEALARKVMGKGIKLKYIEERPPVSLEGGKQTFFIGVYLTGWGWNNQHLGSGQGLNKVMSGNQAARQALLNDKLINEIVAVKQASEAEKRGEKPPA